MDPNILGNFQVCISVPLIIAKWRPGLQVRDSMYSEAGPRGTIRVGWLNLQPLKWLFRASAWWFLVGRACLAGRTFSWAMHGLGWLFGLVLGSGGNCMCAGVTCIPLASPVYDYPQLWYKWGRPNVFLCSHSTSFEINQKCSW